MAAPILSLKIKKTEKGDVREFYLQGKNVTPEKPTDIGIAESERDLILDRMVSEMITEDWDEYDGNFPDVNEKFADYLLDGILPGRGNKDTSQSKYDVGSDRHAATEDVPTREHEIELTESPSFTIFNLPSRVTVVGDGTYEAIRKRQDAYRSNVEALLVREDEVTQTVNTFAEREDVACQTATVATVATGVQAYGFDLADAVAEAMEAAVADGGGAPAEVTPLGERRRDGRRTGAQDFGRRTMYLERILAENALAAEGRTAWASPARGSPQPPAARLVHLFTLTLPGVTGADRRPTVRCTEWSRREAHVLAVGYGRSPDAVALWCSKNPFTPERFYEFDGLIVTCLKFSPQHPNHLAIGFRCGEIIIIDVVSRKLNVLYKISKHCALEINGILDLLWTVRTVDEFPVIRHYECLVACSMNGRVARYDYAETNHVVDEKILMELSHVEEVGLASTDERQNDDTGRRDGHPAAGRKKPAAVFRAARLAELHHGAAYLVGTADGLLYSCLYDDQIACRAKIYAHLGPIRSIDRSPFSRDVFLTVGCDCTIKIWMGDIFQKPVITVHAGKQVERAVWSRTEPTVIASVIGDRIYVWDVDESTEEPASVHEAAGLTDGNKCNGAEFTADGRRLCVSDVDGNVAVYAWSDVAAAAAAEERAPDAAAADRLTYCIAKRLYGRQKPQSVTLENHRPEYADMFARLRDEEHAVRLS